MRRYKQVFQGLVYGTTMFLLILDAKTAITGAKEGIELCLYTVIPSLFPFILLSGRITDLFVGKQISVLTGLGKLLGIPAGGESLLVIGILGGYPVGARSVYEAWQQEQIDTPAAKRLLGFCSNAGPAFIFGMIAPFFSSVYVAWIIWGIHIASAITVGILLPGKTSGACRTRNQNSQSLAQSLNSSIRVMGTICGWVIIFRVIICFLRRWFLWIFPPAPAVGIIGLLELSNGCCELSTVPGEAARFLIACAMLSFGGVCVSMQTVSVTGKLGTGMYFRGKLLQAAASTLFGCIAQYWIFPPSERINGELCILLVGLSLATICAMCIIGKKKVVALCP